MATHAWTRRAPALAALLIAAWPVAAAAWLGGGPDGVEADRARLRAARAETSGSGWTVHTLSSPGEVVREYALPGGVVFALDWRGRARPDLRQLLGPRFADFQAASVGPAGRRLRHAPMLARPDLLVRSGGHPGAYRGFALLPQLAPAGFSLAADS